MHPAGESDFRRFAATTTPVLLAQAGALTGDQRTAEELVTAVLAAVARRWRRLGPDPTDAATRLLYRRYAGRRGRETSQLELLSLDRPVQVAARLRQAAFSRLEPRSQALLVLRYQQERADPELAEIVGSAPAAVAAELDQALARLRELRITFGGPDADDPAADLESEVRETLRERAAATDPAADPAADLAPVALARARRQARIRLGAGAVATVLVLGLGTGIGVVALRPEPPPPDLTGRAVVTQYADQGAPFVLDPTTGDYRLSRLGAGVISPDLRWHLSTPGGGSGTSVQVTSTTDPEDSFALQTPAVVVGLEWSPASTRFAGVVLEVPEPAGGGPATPQPAGQVVLFELAERRVRVLELSLPPDRVVHCCDVLWLGPDRFAVRTGERDRRVSPAPWATFGVATSEVTDTLHGFDLTGAPVAELPIDTGELDASEQPHAGLAWQPVEVRDDGRLLLMRAPEPGSLELAAVDPAGTEGPYRPVTLTLPELPEPYQWLPTVAGLSGATVLITAGLWPDPESDAVPGQPARLVYAMDLDTGGSAPLDVGADLPLPPDLGELTGLGFGDATQLAPAAAHRAFLPPRPTG